MPNVNITEVRLLNVPLENDYLHTLYFDNYSAQTSYFLSKVLHTFNDFSYQRKDNIIRVPMQYDSLLNCNYVMYKNAAYSNKIYYAFITDMQYVDDGRTDITIETDVIQTWLFDYDVKASFIERQHTNVDVPGQNTVPEGLELGEYFSTKKISKRNLQYKGHVIVASTVDLNSEDFSSISGKLYNGVYSGFKLYEVQQNELETLLAKLAKAGKSDAIHAIYSSITDLVNSTRPEATAYAEVDESLAAKRLTWTEGTYPLDSPQEEILKPTVLGGSYEPRNKKLLTYPYCYLLMSNNSGGAAIYHYEKFTTNNCDFAVYASITPGFSIRIVPLNYNGMAENNEEGLNLGKLPICGWNTDVYTNWLTQNGVNIGISVLTGVGSVAAGAALMATGGGALAGAGMIAGGLTGIASKVGEVYTHSLVPPQSEGNVNSGDVTYSSGNLTFTAIQMTIKPEYARIIDDYFDMFGYATHRVAVPLKNHRANYWYTKCVDVNIDGAIPTKDIQKIKDCYNRGITFWKKPSNIQDYSVDNSITQ